MTDDGECRNCYHDESWHEPECQACVDDMVPPVERCQEFAS